MNKLLAVFVLHGLLALTLLARPIDATNKHPIVLVHGFSGWGRKEMLGLPYWGKFQGDFQELLKKEGYQVYTVGIGKFSSNWDRACELYAAIKGGQVDYGLNHSQIHRHPRFGRTYPGVFPQWGTVVNGTLQKVHLMGHSLGGTTIRMLAQLLNKGAGNALTIEAPDTHPLFAGGKDWVHSITTIGSPNRGSTLADMIIDHGEMLTFVTAFASGAASFINDLITGVFDLQLDHWGLKPRQDNETLDAFWTRIKSTEIFGAGFKDNCIYSITVAGSTEENSWVETLPNVYYYSFVADATVPTRNPLQQFVAAPDKNIDNIIEMPIAEVMGSRVTSAMGFSDEWLPNDGLVNVISQISDGVGKVFDFDGRSWRGAWVTFDILRIDHSSLMGMNKKIPMYDVYKAHAALLYNLPSHDGGENGSASSSGSLPGSSANAPLITEHECPNTITKAVHAAHDAVVAAMAAMAKYGHK